MPVTPLSQHWLERGGSAHAVRVLDGEPAAEVTRDYVTALGAAFDRLAGGWR